MKTISDALKAHYASGSTTLARLWRIERTDGRIFAFTDHDTEIEFSGLTYRPTSSFDTSAVATRSEPNVDNLEAGGILDDDGITDEDIEAGRWDGAAVEIREVNYQDLSMGANILRVGELGQVRRRRGQFVVELRGLMQKLQNNIGRVVTPTCDAELGDSRCGVNLDGSPTYRYSGTVVSASSRRLFTASGIARETGYFDGGKVQFTSGANTGIVLEVKEHAFNASPTVSEFDLFLALPFDLAPGDTFTATIGCDKTKATCKDVFGNVVNFRGFSYVPGQDKVLLFGGQ